MIDLVVPYVDSEDKSWQKEFLKHNPKKITEGVNAANRFRGQGDFFKYFFRCIDANLPWIRKIHLLVMSESQVPTWLNTDKVHIVLHKDFIPQKFLPTFNSCTIEMFLWNIPDLAENFIYVNDDIYFMTHLYPDNFFEDNKCKFNITKRRLSSMFGHHCRNCFETLYGPKEGSYLTLGHGPQPMIRSKIRGCYTLNKEKIDNSISNFRSTKNMNAYLYSLYLDKQGQRVSTPVESEYVSSSAIKKQNMSDILNSNVLCLNDDDPEFDIYSDKTLRQTFETLFPHKSSYEIGYNSKKRNSARLATIKTRTTGLANYLDYWMNDDAGRTASSKVDSSTGYSKEENEAFLNAMMRY